MILKCGGTGSSGNCYLLEDSGGEKLLIEAGLPYTKISRLIDYRIKGVVGCIVTHSHLDHSQSAQKIATIGVPVYKPYEQDEKRKSVKFGSYEIKSFPLIDSSGRFVHTNGDGTECPIYGFLISHPEMGTMVYFTDCEFCRYTFRTHDVRHYLIGVNYQEEYAPIDDGKKQHVISGHMSEKTALEFLEANRSNALQNVILCHMSEESCKADELVDHVRKAVETGVNVQVAIPGLQIELYKDCPFG